MNQTDLQKGDRSNIAIGLSVAAIYIVFIGGLIFGPYIVRNPSFIIIPFLFLLSILLILYPQLKFSSKLPDIHPPTKPSSKPADKLIETLQSNGYRTKFDSKKLIIRAKNEDIELRIRSFDKAVFNTRSLSEIEIRVHFISNSNFLINYKNYETINYQTQDKNLNHMLNQPHILNTIRNLFSHSRKTTVEHVNQNLRIVTHFQVPAFKETLEIIEDLIYQLKSSSTDLQNIALLKLEYRCHICNNIIPYDGKKCIFCSSIAPVCVICYADPEPLELVSILVCCKSYGHTNHIRDWLQTNNSCPYCKTEFPNLISVHDHS